VQEGTNVSSVVDGIHHVGALAYDLEAAVRQYERLGFVFTPLSVPRIPIRRGAPPEPVGVANRTAIFGGGNYFEILGIIDSARWSETTPAQRGPYDLDGPLSRYEGLHVLHLASADLDAFRARLVSEGVASSQVRPFERQVHTNDGVAMMRARSLHFPPDAHPEALVQVAQHLTPELVFQPRDMRHPNGAHRITKVFVCVDDPDTLANRYRREFGGSVSQSGRARTVTLGAARAVITDAQGMQDLLPECAVPATPCLAGFVVGVARPQVVSDLLGANGVGHTQYAGGVLIPPQEAAGSVVIFEALE
jgi:catechol 2,3-dioxygenase-like lactoylglutathione lyase family enzyme